MNDECSNNVTAGKCVKWHERQYQITSQPFKNLVHGKGKDAPKLGSSGGGKLSTLEIKPDCDATGSTQQFAQTRSEIGRKIVI